VKYSVLVLWLLFSVCAPCSANVVFKMTCADTSLTIGQESTIQLWAKADDASAVGTNGLNLWQLSMSVSSSNVVEVKTGGITFIAPSPFSVPDSKWLSINSPMSGNVTDLTAQSFNPIQDSTTGVGAYSLIAELIIKGVAQGTTTYSLGGSNFFGALKDATFLDGAFDSTNSDRVFTVIPEPCTFTLLAVMAAAGLYRRK
jgi:hypothetical protein